MKDSVKEKDRFSCPFFEKEACILDGQVCPFIGIKAGQTRCEKFKTFVPKVQGGVSLADLRGVIESDVDASVCTIVDNILKECTDV